MAAASKSPSTRADCVQRPLVPGFESKGSSLESAGRAYLGAIARCQSSICDLMNKRLSTDVQHWQNLIQCRDVSQVAAAQQAWIQEALEDYTAHGKILMNLGKDATGEPTTKD